MNPNDKTYVGRNPCGCIGVLFVDATDSQAEKLATAQRVVQAGRVVVDVGVHPETPFAQ